jgi:hypothetical protein
MIVDVAQLLHFNAILGVTDHGSDLSKWHATLDVVDREEEARAIWDIDCVHFVVLIELKD